jgi:hypothetical protein
MNDEWRVPNYTKPTILYKNSWILEKRRNWRFLFFGKARLWKAKGNSPLKLQGSDIFVEQNRIQKTRCVAPKS